jgi:hypothetical protein
MANFWFTANATSHLRPSAAAFYLLQILSYAFRQNPRHQRATLYGKLKRYNITIRATGEKEEAPETEAHRRLQRKRRRRDVCCCAPPATQVTISSSLRLFGVACSRPSVPSCRQSGESQIPSRRRPWLGAWTTRQSPRSDPSLRIIPTPPNCSFVSIKGPSVTETLPFFIRTLTAALASSMASPLNQCPLARISSS